MSAIQVIIQSIIDITKKITFSEIKIDHYNDILIMIIRTLNKTEIDSELYNELDEMRRQILTLVRDEADKKEALDNVLTSLSNTYNILIRDIAI